MVWYLVCIYLLMYWFNHSQCPNIIARLPLNKLLRTYLRYVWWLLLNTLQMNLLIAL
jgi:hypothetical protein